MKQKSLDNEPISRFLVVCLLLTFFMGCLKQKAHGQFVCNMGVLVGSNGGAGGQLKIGSQLGKVTVAYDMRSYLQSNKPTYFGGYAGYDLADNWELGTGLYYRYQSADRERDIKTNTRLNYFTSGVILTYKRPIWAISGGYLDEHLQLLVSMGLNKKLFYD